MTSKDHSNLKEACRYLDSWLDYRLKTTGLTGLSVAVNYQGKLLLRQSYGLAQLNPPRRLNPRHIFRVASHSKMFTAVALTQLKEKGLLQFDDRVSKHLNWFRSARDPRVARITIRQLLSHRSGIIRDGLASHFWQQLSEFPSEVEFKEFVSQSQCIYNSNETFKYSNFGYAALGLVITAVSGSSYSEYISKNILEPLKLTSTFPEFKPALKKRLANGYSREFLDLKRKPFKHISTHALAAATGFCSTAEDLCKFAQAMMLGKERFLADESKRELFSLLAKINPDGGGYALGFENLKIMGRTLVGHSGGFPGFKSYTAWDPETGLSVSVIGNCVDFPVGLIIQGIYSVLLHFLKSSAPKRLQAGSKQIRDFNGRYYSLWGALDITAVQRVLTLHNPDQWQPFMGAYQLKPVSNQTLRIQGKDDYGSIGEDIQLKRSGKSKKQLFCSGNPLMSLEEFKRFHKTGRHRIAK